jgi:hypothetical protein
MPTPNAPADDLLAEAYRLLRRARDARARGGEDARQCTEFAEAAYREAAAVYFNTADVKEVATAAVRIKHNARACPGKMHRFRGEHEQALVHYRGALAVVEEFARELVGVRECLGPAYHECYVESRLCGYAPAEFANWATRRMETQDKDSRMFAFVHDLAYLRASASSCEPRHLWDTSIASTFHTEDSFDLMVLYGSMCLSAGQMQNAKWFGSALQRFDASVDRMEHMEGVAMQLFDVATGAYALGERRLATERLEAAERIAVERGEFVLVERASAQRRLFASREFAA